MTTEEFYKSIGGDAAEVLGRLPGIKFVKKFVSKFPDDGSFKFLCESMENGNREDAFRAAHTLKGVCQNLGLGTLLSSAEELTEDLRGGSEEIPGKAYELLERVKKDYEETISAIEVYISTNAE
ncbi:MAG: Hpt domain-containing protein [Bacillota bacterium]|nr:Hpt domain-containing protein [Bacillota bacterium]